MKPQLNSNRILEKQQEDTVRIKQILENEMFVGREVNLTGKLFTEDMVIVTAHGVRLVGEDELRKFIQKTGESSLSNVLIKNEILDVIFIRSDVAIVSAVQYIRLQQIDKSIVAGKGTMTFVMVKEVGKWLIAAAQNTLVQDLPFEWNGAKQFDSRPQPTT
ncbi:MAG TPA: SgcJ/EcaC family oxidoreductase [Chryseolinea sp.]|nr:SgcJ/EcaC family oxidoreductase [Chryseolinea sp.]